MKFDLHVHSTHSGDSLMGIEDIINRIKELGFNGFALTDHNTTAGNSYAAKAAKRSGLIFIPGIELSTHEGHIIGLGVKKEIRAFTSAEEAITEIHKQGGLAIAAHPFDFTRHGIGEEFKKLKLDGIESINSKSFVGNKKAVKAAKENKLSVIAGSDAHTTAEMGSAWTECGKNVLSEIKKGNSTAHGGLSVAALKSRVYRRFKGVPLFPKV